MKTYLLAVLACLPLCLLAQDETVKKLKEKSTREIKKEADTVADYWQKGGLYNLNLAQGSLSNWAAAKMTTGWTC